MKRSAVAIVAIALSVLVAAYLLRGIGSDRAIGPSPLGIALTKASFRPVLPEGTIADDGNWTMPSKDYAASRFSTLKEIVPANVATLDVAFTFSTGTVE